MSELSAESKAELTALIDSMQKLSPNRSAFDRALPRIWAYGVQVAKAAREPAIGNAKADNEKVDEAMRQVYKVLHSAVRKAESERRISSQISEETQAGLKAVMYSQSPKYAKLYENVVKRDPTLKVDLQSGRDDAQVQDIMHTIRNSVDLDAWDDAVQAAADALGQPDIDMTPTLRWAVTRAIGESMETELYYTTAPQDFDGFGTYTVDRFELDGEQWRAVRIGLDHITWQTRRYSSGLQRYQAQDPRREKKTRDAQEAKMARYREARAEQKRALEERLKTATPSEVKRLANQIEDHWPAPMYGPSKYRETLAAAETREKIAKRQAANAKLVEAIEKKLEGGANIAWRNIYSHSYHKAVRKDQFIGGSDRTLTVEPMSHREGAYVSDGDKRIEIERADLLGVAHTTAPAKTVARAAEAHRDPTQGREARPGVWAYPGAFYGQDELFVNAVGRKVKPGWEKMPAKDEELQEIKIHYTPVNQAAAKLPKLKTMEAAFNQHNGRFMHGPIVTEDGADVVIFATDGRILLGYRAQYEQWSNRLGSAQQGIYAHYADYKGRAQGGTKATPAWQKLRELPLEALLKVDSELFQADAMRPANLPDGMGLWHQETGRADWQTLDPAWIKWVRSLKKNGLLHIILLGQSMKTATAYHPQDGPPWFDKLLINVDASPAWERARGDEIAISAELMQEGLKWVTRARSPVSLSLAATWDKPVLLESGPFFAMVMPRRADLDRGQIRRVREAAQKA